MCGEKEEAGAAGCLTTLEEDTALRDRTLLRSLLLRDDKEEVEEEEAGVEEEDEVDVDIEDENDDDPRFLNLLRDLDEARLRLSTPTAAGGREPLLKTSSRGFEDEEEAEVTREAVDAEEDDNDNDSDSDDDSDDIAVDVSAVAGDASALRGRPLGLAIFTVSSRVRGRPRLRLMAREPTSTPAEELGDEGRSRLDTKDEYKVREEEEEEKEEDDFDEEEESGIEVCKHVTSPFTNAHCAFSRAALIRLASSSAACC